jgi:hypothetical protein
MTPYNIVLPCVCGKTGWTIPYGFCHCRCGQKTKISDQSETKRGFRKGEPYRFLMGHNRRIVPQVEDAAPVKIEGVYCRLIPLTRGQYAIVDATDYEWLMQWKWNAHFSQNTGTFYATHVDYSKGKRQYIQMHRLILGLEGGDQREGDHRNRVTLDNRRRNLRIATKGENQRNKGIRSANTSGFIGATWKPRIKKWQAHICANRKVIYLGVYATPEEAHTAYAIAAKQHHGEFSSV